MYERGSFIRWTAEDDSGKFSHEGEVLRVREQFVEFVDAGGHEFGVPLDDGQIESIKKPRGWKKVAAPAPVAPKKKSARRVRGTVGVSKLDQVAALLQAEPSYLTDRKAAIKKIVEQIGMTPAGASTYYSNAKKRLT